ELDLRNEKIGYKVREHSIQKIPVILAVGTKEAEAKSVSMRRIGSKEQKVLSLDEATESLGQEATRPSVRRTFELVTQSLEETLEAPSRAS
ncbi:MAG: His/Gly/Thr/Pro-type tRNA ligase C-terminal domain-containing protein, partial [Myxococcota bacterium]